jgi:RNA polymerase sigma factor (sigma-70 family)
MPIIDFAIADSTVAREDERAIASSIAAGDRLAFECLMRRYNRRLYRLARATLRDRTEAEDALQDAYICAYRSIGQFRGEASLSTWLSRLVLNECLGRIRRSARRQNVISIVSPNIPIESTTMFANESDSPDKELGRAQMRELLERKVDELPANFRAVFVLRSVEELSVDETAGSLGIPAETVRSRHFRAKTMLRESLAREFNLAESDLFEFGGAHCDQVVANVLARLAT